MQPMADLQLKDKIREALKNAYFHDVDDFVDVSDGPEDSIHIVIVSRKLAGHRLKEKDDLMWGILIDSLTADEFSRVSLSVWTSPEEIKAS